MPVTIAPTATDIDALSRLVVAEAANIAADFETAYNNAGISGSFAEHMARTFAYGSIIDQILNRVAAQDSQYGLSIEAVINKNALGVWQYSAVRAANGGTGETWEDLEEADPDIEAFVEAHLSARANGQPSVVGAATHYYNPNLVSPPWGPDLESPIGFGTNSNYHLFGVLPETDPVPGNYTVDDGINDTSFIPFPPVPEGKPIPPGFLAPPSLPNHPPSQFEPTDVAPPLPGWIDEPRDDWGDGFNPASPLVLDLDGDGIELTAFNALTTETFFDVDGDGFAEQTAWVDSDDGLLAIDLNENGRIDGVHELFGSTTVDGFAIFQELDTNGDHLINQYDDAWANLVVWQDADGDAFTDGGELVSLATLDIVSFDLASITPSSSTTNGNPISHTSTFKYGNGSTDVVADAWFVHDAVNTYYTGEFTLDARTLFLPTLRGFGELADLHIAMSLDESLLNLVQDFAIAWDYSRFADGADLDGDIEEILFTWAGVEGVSSTSRGFEFDARRLGFMEKFFAEDYLYQNITPNPAGAAVRFLEQAWTGLSGAMRAQLILQSGAASLFDNPATYNPWTGEIDGDMNLSSSAIGDLETEASQMGVDEQEFWIAVAQFFEYSKGFANFTSTENGWLNSAIYDTDPSLTWAAIKEYADPFFAGSTYVGTSGADTINGSSGADTISGLAGNDTLNGGYQDDAIHGDDGNDVIHGNDGDDTITGGNNNDTIYGDDGDDSINAGSGDDILFGGAGNDSLTGGNDNDELTGGDGADLAYGGSGNDTFFYSAGDDYYESGSGTDVVKLPSGIVLGDLVLVRTIESTEELLYITVGSLGSIQTKFFQNGYGLLLSDRIDSIVFNDTSTYNPSSFTALTTYGSEDVETLNGVYTTIDIVDTLYGLGGNDTLYGNGGADTLDGGTGNDILYGGVGNDTYVASAGFDVIYESSSGGTDTILIPDGYEAADVSLLRKASALNDLEVTIAGLGQIRVSGQFSHPSAYVDYLQLFGETAISLSSLSIETVGSSGNDTLTAFTSGGGSNDVMDGRGGNDVLQGMAGNDTYYFSSGTDTISESSGNDTIAFRAGVLPSSISIYRGGANFDALVVADGNGNVLTSTTHFTREGYSSNATYEIEQIVFADSTTWNLSSMEIEAHGNSSNNYMYAASDGDASSADTMFGYGGADVMNGLSGNDYLDGGDGNDSFDGGSGNDIIIGGTGDDYVGSGNDDDLIIYHSGMDQIYDGHGTDELRMANGITIENVSVTDGSYTHTRVIVNASTNEVQLNNFRASTSLQIETISFSDGFRATLPDYNSWVKGTSGNNTLTGTSGHDVIIGYAGNDTISGAADSDNIHGGTGADTLNGGNGADLLHGGTGDDVLYGNDGLDTLFGGAGADDFIFESASAFNNVDVIKDFSANDNDTIDISDVLDTYYTAGVDVLTDFVQMTTNGANSELRVDTTGSANFGSGTLIAVIEGITGLTDEVALATAGRLIAA